MNLLLQDGHAFLQLLRLGQGVVPRLPGQLHLFQGLLGQGVGAAALLLQGLRLGLVGLLLAQSLLLEKTEFLLRLLGLLLPTLGILLHQAGLVLGLPALLLPLPLLRLRGLQRLLAGLGRLRHTTLDLPTLRLQFLRFVLKPRQLAALGGNLALQGVRLLAKRLQALAVVPLHRNRGHVHGGDGDLHGGSRGSAPGDKVLANPGGGLGRGLHADPVAILPSLSPEGLPLLGHVEGGEVLSRAGVDGAGGLDDDSLPIQALPTHPSCDGDRQANLDPAVFTLSLDGKNLQGSPLRQDGQPFVVGGGQGAQGDALSRDISVAGLCATKRGGAEEEEGRYPVSHNGDSPGGRGKQTGEGENVAWGGRFACRKGCRVR